MDTHIQHILKNVFGFDSLRPAQSDIICHILNGQNILAVMPTGSGKSLCFQIPALLSDKKNDCRIAFGCLNRRSNPCVTTILGWRQNVSIQAKAVKII